MAAREHVLLGAVEEEDQVVSQGHVGGCQDLMAHSESLSNLAFYVLVPGPHTVLAKYPPNVLFSAFGTHLRGNAKCYQDFFCLQRCVIHG